MLAAVYALCHLTGGSAISLSFSVGYLDVSVADKVLLASLKDPAEQLTLRSTVVDYGNTPLLPGDKVHVALPNEGFDGDFRILSAEYNVDAKTQVLETVMDLGREKPLLADYIFSLKSKTDSLSRYKLARV